MLLRGSEWNSDICCSMLIAVGFSPNPEICYGKAN